MFVRTVNAVNDAPSCTKGANQSVNATAGVQTVPGWATAISAGPTDEAGQSLDFKIASNNNSALFTAQPAVAAKGILTYTPASSGNGTATIGVQIHDNGGTANGGADTSAVQTFTIAVMAQSPGTVTLAEKSAVVPGAGTDPRIPAGAKWSVFGEPSITMNGTRAGWLATVLPPVPAPAFRGIFSGPLAAPVLRFKTGEGATDAAGTAVTGVRFTAFREPVFAGEDFAFGATVAGTGVGAVNDTGIWASVGGALREVARESKVAPGVSPAKFLAFTSVAMPAPDVVFFTALLAAPTTKDLGLWRWTSASGTQLVLREGDMMDLGAGLSPLLSFKALTSVTGSPGHGRYNAGTGAIDVVLIQANRTQAIRSIAVDGSLNGTQRTGVADGQGRVPLAFDVPSSPGMGAGASVRTTFALNAGGITAANNSAILDGDGQTILAQKGVTAADAGTAKFGAFREPVAGIGAGGKRVTAFAATLSGSVAAQDTGIWKYTEGGALTLVAREGVPATDAGSAKWTSFTSLSVLEGRGPMFTAKLLSGVAGVTGASDTGLWATDSTGTLRLVLRTGDTIAGKKLQSFFVLGAVANSPGQRRAWTGGDASARVIYRAFFIGGSSAILSTAVP